MAVFFFDIRHIFCQKVSFFSRKKQQIYDGKQQCVGSGALSGGQLPFNFFAQDQFFRPNFDSLLYTRFFKVSHEANFKSFNNIGFGKPCIRQIEKSLIRVQL